MMSQYSDRCFVATHIPRILLSLLFVIGGFTFLLNFDSTVQFVGMGLTPWGLGGMATLATIIAIVLKLGGGLMLLVNYKTSYAAWMLIIFTVLATLLYHTNWNGADAQMQFTNFLKNLAVLGGLLLYANCFCAKCKGTAPASSETPAV